MIPKLWDSSGIIPGFLCFKEAAGGGHRQMLRNAENRFVAVSESSGHFPATQPQHHQR
jgi:hypothetical protein